MSEMIIKIFFEFCLRPPKLAKRVFDKNDIRFILNAKATGSTLL
jgi:hypothetical protein